MLTKQALKEFEEIWRQDNPGREISPEELSHLAERVLNAFKVILSK